MKPSTFDGTAFSLYTENRDGILYVDTKIIEMLGGSCSHNGDVFSINSDTHEVQGIAYHDLVWDYDEVKDKSYYEENLEQLETEYYNLPSAYEQEGSLLSGSYVAESANEMLFYGNIDIFNEGYFAVRKNSASLILGEFSGVLQQSGFVWWNDNIGNVPVYETWTKLENDPYAEKRTTLKKQIKEAELLIEKNDFAQEYYDVISESEIRLYNPDGMYTIEVPSLRYKFKSGMYGGAFLRLELVEDAEKTILISGLDEDYDADGDVLHEFRDFENEGFDKVILFARSKNYFDGNRNVIIKAHATNGCYITINSFYVFDEDLYAKDPEGYIKELLSNEDIQREIEIFKGITTYPGMG